MPSTQGSVKLPYSRRHPIEESGRFLNGDPDEERKP